MNVIKQTTIKSMNERIKSAKQMIIEKQKEIEDCKEILEDLRA